MRIFFIVIEFLLLLLLLLLNFLVILYLIYHIPHSFPLPTLILLRLLGEEKSMAQDVYLWEYVINKIDKICRHQNSAYLENIFELKMQFYPISQSSFFKDFYFVNLKILSYLTV